jgi:hypothetical protein
MTLKVKGMEQLQANINNMILGVGAASELALAEAAVKGAAVAKQHTKGKLRENTYAQPLGKQHWQIISNKFYAQWYEYGNGPPGSRIYPVSAKALCFQMNGKTVCAKSVKASPAHPYMTLAHAWLQDNLSKIMKKHILSLITRTK